MSTTRTTDRPTIVLVHGAFADSSGWDGVIERLLDDDLPVVAVANPLRGVRSDSAYLAGVLKSLPGEVVLVAHSYGGMLASHAATGSDNVKALVFVGAFAPDAGETAADLTARFEGSTLADAVEPIALADGTTDLAIAQDRFGAQFAADVPADLARSMAVTQRPIAAAALSEGSGTPAWKTIPSWFVFGTADRNIPVEALRFMAQRAGSRRTVEVEGASHAVAISQPQVVADLVREAAQATADAAIGRADRESAPVAA